MSQHTSVPNHIGIIMDGNRRWAKVRGLPTVEGHKTGFNALQSVAERALDKGVKYLTVYAFSTENWARSKDEVNFLLVFLRQMLKKEIATFHKRNIRFVWFGLPDKLDKKLVKDLQDAEDLTKANTNGTFCLCFNYGGRQEIVDAANRALESGNQLTEESLSNELYGGNDIPPVDFLIRTSGECRISNFMLWRAAYSELYFTDVLWPDFTAIELDKALAEYASRQRRFGK